MILNKLLTHGADLNIVDELERTPTYYLIRCSYTQTLQLDAWNAVRSFLITSLRYGAILNKGDIIGMPLLHRLMENCLSTKCFDLKSFMEVLHQRYTVDVNCQDIQGRTVLHLMSANAGPD